MPRLCEDCLLGLSPRLPIWAIMLTTQISSPEMAVTVQLPILSVKKNPQNPLYTQLGVLTKGTVLEVNVSELGLVTTSGKVVWGKFAQVTNSTDPCP